MTTEITAYREVFVFPDDEAAKVHFECNRCGRETNEDPCPDHAPTEFAGLRLVDCWSTPRHLIWVHDREDYGAPCALCRLIPYIEREAEARQCRHWPIRHSRPYRWFAGWLYRLGIVSGTGSTWGEGHDWCTNLYWRGQRPYILGASRYTWRCWFKGHRRGEETGVFGYCGTCLPWPCCGSVGFNHEDDCAADLNAARW